MQVKTCPITVKTAGTHEGVDEGIVEAIVAAYNVDSVGDQIIPGAFAKSLARHTDAGNRLPFVWSHRSDDPDSYIGEVIEAKEVPEGLWVRAKLDMDEPKAAKVYRLLKGRRVSQFSFAYTETDARPATKSSAPGALKELHELDIHECGPTMVGANQATSLLGVKHSYVSERVLSPAQTAAYGQVVSKAEACPSCGHAPTEKHNATAPAGERLVDTGELGADGRIEWAGQPEHQQSHESAPAPLTEERVAELISASLQNFLRDRAEVGVADQAAPPITQNADDEATPAAAPAADFPPAAAVQPAESSVPASPGTATGRQLPELALLQAEFDELTI